MNLSKRIRDCRYSKGWGPDELAARAEISRTALYQIESGKTELPRASTLRRIARALDLSIDVLLGNAEVGTFELSTFAQSETPPVATATIRKSAWEWSEEVGASSIPVAGETFAARSSADSAGLNGAPSIGAWSTASREVELSMKLGELLASPLGDGVARVIEETHRLLLLSMPARRLG